MYALYYIYVYVCLCARWVWACLWWHRFRGTRACDCARRRCGRRHHVRAWVRPPGYISQSHTSCTIIHIYASIDAQSGYVNGYVCVLAYACDRVRALTMREYAAFVRVRRAHFVRPSMDGTRTGIVCRYMMHACIYIHARLATPTNGSPMRARRILAPRAASVRARSGGVDRGWLGCRRSTRRRRSTRTSARGTPPRSPLWPMYAPAFRPKRRATAGGTRSAGGRCGAGRCARRRRRCVLAWVCADVWARACAGVHVCRYSCAYESRLYVCL
jgi:hypothetical protein